MASQDVEAGKAYVTLYLRRVGFDRQLDEVKRDSQKTESQGGQQPQQPYTEAGISIPSELAEAAAKGAAARAGGVMLAKLIPLFREAGTAAAVAAPAVASVGTAAAATAPAIAATGTAAAGSATGFAAMTAAALPILVPLAAIAAVAATIYVALFKWQDLPLPVKALLLVLSPLVAVCRAVALAVKAVGLAISVVTAPFRLAAAGVGLFYRAIVAIPGAIAAIPGLLVKVAQAAWSMGKRVATAAWDMAAAVGKAAVATGAALARLPGQLAGYASSAVTAVAGAVQSLGMTIGKAGAVAAGLSAAIVGPLTVAAQQFSEYGDKIQKVRDEYQRFALTAEETSVIIRVSEQTGESIQKLAEQMRDGTRDFSRWRAEVQASGMSMSGPGLGAALALSRAYYALKESLSGLRNVLGEAIAPAVTESTQVITGAVRAVIAWVSNNKPLIAQIFKVASIVGTVAAGITTLGGAIAGAGALLSPFTAALAAIAAGLAIVEVRTGAGRSIWAAYGDSVKRVYTTVVSYLGQMAAFAGKVFGGVKDALIAGDLAGAVNVLWAGAKVAWITGLMEIDVLTRGMFGGILNNLAAGRWAAAGEAVMGALQIAWQTGVIAIAGMWRQIVDAADSAWVGLQDGFDAAMGGIKKGWASVWESVKIVGLQAFTWMLNNVFAPIAKWLAQNDITGVLAKKSRQGLSALVDAHIAMKKSLKSPEEQAAGAAAIDAETAASQQARQDDLIRRRGERETAADRARLDRETEIERLRRRQAELAAQGAAASAPQLAENQQALDRAIAAAKAARAAADAARPTEEDFAVSTATESISRFSGEALGLAVGRSANDPQSKIAKFSEDQLKELRTIANSLKLTFDEVLRLQAMGGFV